MSRRTERLARAIREVVSSTILFELRDPRVKNVTVLGAEVAGDLRTAKVYVSVMGDDRASQLALHGLNSARGYIQSRIDAKVELRYTPVLTFVLDESIKRSFEAAEVLREIEEREGPINPDGHSLDEHTGTEGVDEFDVTDKQPVTDVADEDGVDDNSAPSA